MTDQLKKILICVAAALAAGMLLVWLLGAPASAADLGGNCCTDLEERIAELEATTARKGNKKVSLTVTGWVAEQITYWDDGTDSNTYVGGVGKTMASHLKFSGAARINSDVSAGYALHIEAASNDPLVWDQDGTGEADGVSVLKSYWWLKSDKVGSVALGKMSSASDNAAISVDGSGSSVPANWVLFDGGGFALRSKGVRLDQALANLTPPPLVIGITTDRPLSWGSQLGYCAHTNAGLGADCNGEPLDVVRYDSPVFSGFSVSAAWGEDDMWDVALRYAGEFSGFKLAAAVAYSDANEGTVDSQYSQAAAYIEHVASGLFLYGAYGREQNSGTASVDGDLNISIVIPPVTIGPFGIPFSVAGIEPNDSDHWYAKAGMRTKLNTLGHTVGYGEYGIHNDQLGPELLLLGAETSEIKRWGVGVVQEIDAASMSVWLKYRHMEGEASGGGTTIEFDDIDFIGAGALINF